MFFRKIASLTTYILEALLLITVLLRLALGRDVPVANHVISLSEAALYILALRLCVPMFIRGDVYSIVGLKVSSQDEKLTCFLTGLGLIVLYNLIVYL